MGKSRRIFGGWLLLKMGCFAAAADHHDDDDDDDKDNLVAQPRVQSRLISC
jgi:hypothetical protein